MRFPHTPQIPTELRYPRQTGATGLCLKARMWKDIFSANGLGLELRCDTDVHA